jgi:hypothetical protein
MRDVICWARESVSGTFRSDPPANGGRMDWSLEIERTAAFALQARSS